MWRLRGGGGVGGDFFEAAQSGWVVGAKEDADDGFGVNGALVEPRQLDLDVLLEVGLAALPGVLKGRPSFGPPRAINIPNGLTAENSAQLPRLG
jgi:hypothetical protein